MNFLGDKALQRLRERSAEPDLSDTPYSIVRGLASGGMGDVYLVHDERLKRKVAMKVMNAPEVSVEQVRLLEREARIIARLEHPGIIPIHDVGQLPDGRAWYTMMYVQGSTLDLHLRTLDSLPEKLRLLLKVCEALAFAHAHGVVHRDIKPGNIMVGEFGAVLLMDWGIARVLHEGPGGSVPDHEPKHHNAGAEHTLGGMAAGTPAYMAPEQSAAHAPDPRGDVYALGAVLFQLLCGTAPPEHVEKPHNGILPALRRFRPRIPRPLAAICSKAMHPDAARRYADAAHMADDLVRYLGNLPLSAYRENIYEKAMRLVARHRFIALLLFAYLLTKIILFFLTRL